MVAGWWGYGILLGPEGTNPRAPGWGPWLIWGFWLGVGLFFLGHPALGIIPGHVGSAAVVVGSGWLLVVLVGVGVCVV